MTEFFKHHRLFLFRAAYLAVAFYVAGVTGFWSAHMFFANVFSNDQCVWSPEKIDNRRELVFRNILDGGVADRAGILEGDRLAAINGKTFKDEFEAQAILNAFTPADTVYYKVIRNGVELTFPLHIVKTYSTLHISFIFLGLSLWVVGLIVILSRPRDRVPVLFFLMAMTGVVLFALGGGLIGNRGEVSKAVIIHVLVSIALFPALFYHFFISFPLERYKSATRRWVIPAAYLLSMINTAYGIYTTFVYNNFSGLSITLVFVAIGYAFAIFCRSYSRIQKPELRKPLRSILIGSSIGMSGFVYLLAVTTSVPFLFINHPELLLPVAVVALIPLSFGYSVFRYRLMDIEIVIKKSLIYTATTSTLALGYVAVLMILDYAAKSFWGGTADDRMIQSGSLIMVALIFTPIRNYFQGLVDKKFFRDRYNYQKALLEFSKELPTLTGLDQIVRQVIGSVKKTMHIESVSLVLFDGNGKDPGVYHHDGSVSGTCRNLTSVDNLIGMLRTSRTARLLYEVALNELPIPETEKNIIRSCRIVAAVPMMKSDRLNGILFLGPKQSERMFSTEDIDLLMTVANQTAIAIENARLMKNEIDQMRYENELQVARRIQQSLLPHEKPVIPGLDFAGCSIPAYSVGGDYFDYIALDENRLLISIGDVSGKGVSAALYMSKIQGMIQVASQLYSSPKNILSEVNQWMYKSMDRQSFVTIVLALIDIKKKSITICRAGHNPVIAVRGGRLHTIQCKGIGIGLTDSAVFTSQLEENTRALEDGSQYVFYTDGVTEAMNERYEEYGEEKLFGVIQQKKNSSSELLDSILSSVKQFQGTAEQHDDITVVVITYTDKPA